MDPTDPDPQHWFLQYCDLGEQQNNSVLASCKPLI
jgi:hypothetical protein